MPLFARLKERELLRVMQAASVRAFDAGDIVIREGTSGDELFIVLRGHVLVERSGEPLTRLGVGEHFGEMALLRAVPRSATVRAEEPAELIILRRADFFDILRNEHEIAVKMLWQFLGVLANRLDQTSSELREAISTRGAVDVNVLHDPTVEIFGGLDRSDSAPPGRAPSDPTPE